MISQFLTSQSLLLSLAGLLGATSFSYFAIWAYSKMPSLNHAPADVAILSMNALNKAKKKPLMLALYILTPMLYIGCGLLTQALTRHNEALFFYLSAILYVIGVLGVTLTISEPLNFQLAQLRLTDPQEAQSHWALFFKKWQFWNKIRLLSSALSLILFFLGTLLN